MLSIEDLYKEIGKNIFICPLSVENFKDNSIDLTASRFAFTPEKDYLFDETTGYINIPPHKTACILTQESIYVSGKIGGTYHSRVSMVQRGLGHIGTMLDPKYCGQSLIMLHNITDSEVKIKEGERLVSIIFHYLRTPIYEGTLSTPPGHIAKVASMDKDNIYQAWLSDNQWVNNPLLLKRHFENSYLSNFKEMKKKYAQDKGIISKIVSSRGFKYCLKYFAIILFIVVALGLVKIFFTPENTETWANYIIPSIICLVGLFAADFSGIFNLKNPT